MLDVRPFAGIRYRLDSPDQLAHVVSPPYDVISPEQRQQLVQRSAHNVVRVDLPTEEDPPGSGDRYERAARLWRQWLTEGVLAREQKPAFYAYRQVYDPGDGQPRTRWGLMAQVRLAEYGEGIVFPHERTLSAPREDRLRLQRATRLNLSPVFGLHFGATESLDALLEELCQGEPDGMVVDEDGVDHRLWVIQDEAACRRIRAALEPARIVIADGHHRYETALAYRQERRAQAGKDASPDAGWNYVLMVLTAIDSPGLTVLPTHRIVRGIEDLSLDQVLQRMGDHFHLTPIAVEGNPARAVGEGLAALGKESGFVVYGGGGKGWVARARDAEGLMARLAPDRSAPWRRLEVALLHTAVIELVLGLDAAAQAGGQFIEYTRSLDEALEAVDAGRGQVAFLLRPNSPEEVRDVALAGDSMPQKSTYFYPKLLTGLVFCDLDAPVAAL